MDKTSIASVQREAMSRSAELISESDVLRAKVGMRQATHRGEPGAVPHDSQDNTGTPLYVWYVLILLCIVNVFSYMDRTALSVLLPFIKKDLELSDTQLGLLVGLAFFLFYAACGIPIARWADQGNRKNIIAIMLTVWSVMTALSGAAQNFWHLLLARVGLGAGEAGCIPAAQSIISDYVPIKRRSGMYALHTFGMSMGTVLGLLVAGWLGEVIGWRWTFFVLGVPGILVAVLVGTTLREPVRGASDGLNDAQERPSFAEALRALFGCATYRLLLIAFVINGFTTTGLLQWWPSFYGRVFEITPASVGISLGLAVGAGSSAGTILGGIVAQKAAQRHIGLPLVCSAAAILLATPAAIGSLFASSAAISMLLAGTAILLWSVPVGPITATMYNVTRPRMRATASAVTLVFISILGFGLAPLSVGLLSDALTPIYGDMSIRYALLLPAGLLPVLMASLFVISKTVAKDLKAAGVAGL